MTGGRCQVSGLKQPASRIRCDEVVVARGGRRAVDRVSLQFETSEAIAIIGPNGAGKTTFLQVLLGWLRPEGGAVSRDGANWHRQSTRRRAQVLAYVPQRMENVPDQTVREVVEGGRYARRSWLAPMRARDREIVDAAIRRCRLEHLASRSLRAISVGERQKAMLAAALAQEAEMILLDEPSAALDPPHEAELVAILREQRAAGRGFILVSHALELPALVARRVIAMVEGAIVADGPVEEVMTPEPLKGVFGANFGEYVGPGGQRVVLPAYF